MLFLSKNFDQIPPRGSIGRRGGLFLGKNEDMSTRNYWVKTLVKIAEPVLFNMANGRLTAVMPVESNGFNRHEVTYLEALGRTLVGIAPWLETAAEDPVEEEERLRLGDLARRAIDAATNPASPDYCRFNAPPQNQILVDAAFLSHAILRAPTALFAMLDTGVQQNLITALQQTRVRLAYRSNWLLFPAMIEAALFHMTGECDLARVDHALLAHEGWYVGDGVYGDGPAFHADYYNSYVIQPMLLDVLKTLSAHPTYGHYCKGFYEKALKRARRYAEIQERLVAPDGSFPAVGRSLAYRTGAFQLLAQCALYGELPEGLSPAAVRCALTAVMRRCFEAKDTFDEKGFLRVGLCGHQPSIGETYISTGSLYLCTPVFLPLGLPASHDFWRLPDEPYTAQRVWSGLDVAVDHAYKD